MVSSRLYFFDRLQVSQCLSTTWLLSVPEFIVAQHLLSMCNKVELHPTDWFWLTFPMAFTTRLISLLSSLVHVLQLTRVGLGWSELALGVHSSMSMTPNIRGD